MDPSGSSEFLLNFPLFILLNGFLNPLTFPVFSSMLVALLLICCSAVMAASEIAFFSISSVEKGGLRESQEPADKRIVKLLDNQKYLLSTVLIANNIVNIGIIIIFYFIITNLFNFQDIQIGSFTFPKEAFDFIINIVVVTFFLVLFGEAIPKVYASHNKIPIARGVSNLFVFLNRLLYPINFILVKSTSVIERRIKKHSSEMDLEEIKQAIDITVESKDKRNDTNMLKGIVEFGNISVKQIMRPRTLVAAADITWDFGVLLDYIREHGYSRLPVYEESLDSIKGVIYIKDLLEHFNKPQNFPWQKLIREPLHTPATKKIDDLLREFQESRKHLAIVVDEFGGTSGIVTLEDIVEEVVGEINDEFDDAGESFVKKIKEDTYIFEGVTPLSDVIETLEIEEEILLAKKGDAETLSGFLIEQKGNFPKAGEELIFENYRFKILGVKDFRIEKIKVEKIKIAE